MIRYRAWWHVGYRAWAISFDRGKSRGRPILIAEDLGKALDALAKRIEQERRDQYHQH